MPAARYLLVRAVFGGEGGARSPGGGSDRTFKGDSFEDDSFEDDSKATAKATPQATTKAAA
ncbi:hypothetical protein ACFWPU_41785 [Streptomyces sp. NPDC058471]|uniref:hypothetical protein n=1 Tax=Streptomyces sp. NPDC058471 TaxID=3346516 RepID=UPI00365BDC97